MECFFLLLSFFALCVIAVFITAVFKVPGATAPLVAISFTIIYFTVFGIFNLLNFAGYLYFALACAIVFLLAVKKIVFPKMTLWFYVFIAVCSVMAVFFAIRQPLLNSWDEFSFWGTAVKLTQLNNELHTTAEIGWDWVASQKPGLIVLSYFFQFFGSYAEWKIFVSLNILAFSVITAALAPFKGKSKNIAIVPACILFLTPFVFTIYNQMQEPSNVYMNAHSDVPMAWLFCGVFIMYYALKNKGARLWPVSLVVTALTLTRDTALPFALITWAIISFDLIFFTDKSSVKFLRFNGLTAKFAHVFALLSCILVTFFGWAYYISYLIGENALGNVGGTEEIGMVSMLIMGITQLFGVNTTQFFSETMSSMYYAFFNLPMSMFGTGKIIVIVIICILAVSAFSSCNKAHTKTCLNFLVLSSIGFVMYYIFIGFTFAFIFKDDTATQLIGYERYIYPYYIGWFAVSVFLLCLSALTPKKWFMFLPQGALFCVLFVFANRFSLYVPNGMSFVDYHEGYFYDRQHIVNTANDVVELIGNEPEGNIFFISQADNGSKWFQYSGDVLPLQIDYSFGGGTLTLKGIPSDDIYAYEMSHEELADYLIENNCAYVFVEQSSYVFFLDFGALFSDNLKATDGDKSAIYKVETESGDLRFELMGGVGE